MAILVSDKRRHVQGRLCRGPGDHAGVKGAAYASGGRVRGLYVFNTFS
jgi:hypothetical protein